MTLYRPSAEALSESLAGIGHATGVRLETLWEACALVDEPLGDMPVPPLSPRDAVRAAEHGLPAVLVAALDDRLRRYGQADRLDEVLEELGRIRVECGWPPLQEPIGNIIGSQALLHVLAAQRWQAVVDEVRLLFEGRYGTPPRPVDPVVARAVELLGDGRPEDAGAPERLEDLRQQAEGLATSEEELLLLALFGTDAEPLLRTIRARARGEELAREGVDESRADRIRELVALVQESGIGEVTIEEGEMRVTVRRGDEAVEAPVAPLAPLVEELREPEPPSRRDDSLRRVESPMVGVFYRAAHPEEPPFVEVGDTVATGQTLCLLEAMKLFNEVKAELDAIVRSICVENAHPVEYGQLLFELEPVDGRPVDAL
jgi:oxaloacetate decarboxylase alpha subunit